MMANTQTDIAPGKPISREDYLTAFHGFLNVTRLALGHAALLSWLLIAHQYLSLPYYIVLSIVFCQIHQRELNDWAHEACHWNLVPNRTLNDFLGYVLASFWFGAPLSDLRRTHFIHHRTKTFFDSGDPETFSLKINSKRALIKGIIEDLTGVSAFKHYIGFLRRRPENNASAQGKKETALPWPILQTVVVHAIIFLGLIWAGRWDIYLIYYGTLVTFYRLSHRIRIYAQHLCIPGNGIGTCNDSTVARTVCCNLFSKLIYASDVMLFHYEHHKQPGLPYRALRKICARRHDPNMYVEQMRPVHEALWKM